LSHTFDPNELYNRVVHFYIDKKGYSKEKANTIARSVVEREKNRHTCKNANCGHRMEDHIRHSETCLVLDCECSKFVN